MQNAVSNCDYLIIGAGPAGLQLAYFMEKQGDNYLVLEAGTKAGTFFAKYPRHRTLLSINKRFTGRKDPEFNLRHDWNSLISDDEELRFTKYSKDYFPNADDLVDYLGDFAQHTGLRIRYETQVEEIRKSQEGRFRYAIQDQHGHVYQTQVLIVATGIGTPNIPEIPGIELATGYEDMSVDPDDFADQSVLILGKGNSAFETADNLVGTASLIHLISPRPVRLAWNTRFVGDLRAINNSVLDTYHLKSQNAVIDGNIECIYRSADTGKLVVKFASIHAENETEQLEYDHILRCLGFRFDTSMFSASCMPKMRDCGRLPLLTHQFESINHPHMFFVGAPMQALDYKRCQSAFIHGFRYNARCLSYILGQRYAEREWPSEEIPNDDRQIVQRLLERMNRASSLWQQVGFIADLLVVPKSKEEPVRYYFDLPYDYAIAYGSEFSRGGDFFISMFQLGHAPENAFDHPRSANVFEGESSTAIHPVVEHHGGGAIQSTFHVLEDFLGDWSGIEYADSLYAYFSHVRTGEALHWRDPLETRNIVRDHNMRLVNKDGVQV